AKGSSPKLPLKCTRSRLARVTPRPNVTSMDSRQVWESLPSSRTSHVWPMSLDMAKRDSPKLTSPSTTQGHV
ncbi:hypothetical protein PIB30_095253, partial [Stylosanthes scabra]|nr:hypothetical protein [Stylosanthes scabra]